jgi:DNA-binding transcriptional ArsR family regulator
MPVTQDASARHGGMSVYARQERAVRVGLVGPHDLVERIMLSGLPGPGNGLSQTVPSEAELGLRRRLVMVPYRSEHEAPERVTRLGDSVDACLFASRIPLEYARRAGVLNFPATCIQLGGTTLVAAVARARRAGVDLSRASFDGLTRTELEAGLAELDIPADGVHVREEITSAAAFASFHERLWRLGMTSAAATCLDQVARRLTAAQVPVLKLTPADQAISSALQVATLLAAHRVLADSQLAVALIEVPALRDAVRRSAPRQARQELQLTVHRFLVREAQRIQATASRVSDSGFLVLASRASLAAAGSPPFAAKARQALGVAIEVGVGTGRTEHEAEAQARLALDQAAQAGRTQTAGSHTAAAELAVGSGRRGTGLDAGRTRLDSDGAARLPADSLSRVRALEILSRLARKLAADSVPVVDAELTGQLLSVTPRTARRQLRALVDEGLALPLPPARRPRPGRPRQAYRLVVEKLDRQSG